MAAWVGGWPLLWLMFLGSFASIWFFAWCKFYSGGWFGGYSFMGWQVWREGQSDTFRSSSEREYILGNIRDERRHGQRLSKTLNNLGVAYARGFGVPQSYKNALYWFQKGALRGDASAQANLAKMYEAGIEVGRDLGLARHWYSKAAAHEFGPAKTRLAALLKNNA